MKQTKSYSLMTPIRGRVPGDELSIRLEQRHWNSMKVRLEQVFEVDDILTLSEDITALSGGDSEKKTGILSSASSSISYRYVHF